MPVSADQLATWRSAILGARLRLESQNAAERLDAVQRFEELDLELRTAWLDTLNEEVRRG